MLVGKNKDTWLNPVERHMIINGVYLRVSCDLSSRSFELLKSPCRGVLSLTSKSEGFENELNNCVNQPALCMHSQAV